MCLKIIPGKWIEKGCDLHFFPNFLFQPDDPADRCVYPHSHHAEPPPSRYHTTTKTIRRNTSRGACLLTYKWFLWSFAEVGSLYIFIYARCHPGHSRWFMVLWSLVPLIDTALLCVGLVYFFFFGLFSHISKQYEYRVTWRILGLSQTAGLHVE